MYKFDNDQIRSKLHQLLTAWIRELIKPKIKLTTILSGFKLSTASKNLI